MRPRVIGIMGGVASGKSMVAEMLGSLGAEVIHADEMAHELLEKPEIKEKVLKMWGKGLLGGERKEGGEGKEEGEGKIDRGKLASIVFSNREDLKELTNLLHPPILESIRRLVLEQSEGEVDRKGKGSIPLVIDAALLLETGLDEACDLLVFVEASPEVKEERSRLKGWSRGEVQRREGFQAPESQKRKKAHVVINNDSSKEETFRQVKDFWQKLVL